MHNGYAYWSSQRSVQHSCREGYLREFPFSSYPSVLLTDPADNVISSGVKSKSFKKSRPFKSTMLSSLYDSRTLLFRAEPVASQCRSLPKGNSPLIITIIYFIPHKNSRAVSESPRWNFAFLLLTKTSCFAGSARGGFCFCFVYARAKTNTSFGGACFCSSLYENRVGILPPGHKVYYTYLLTVSLKAAATLAIP